MGCLQVQDNLSPDSPPVEKKLPFFLSTSPPPPGYGLHLDCNMGQPFFGLEVVLSVCRLGIGTGCKSTGVGWEDVISATRCLPHVGHSARGYGKGRKKLELNLSVRV